MTDIDWQWADSGGRRIFSLVGQKLSSQKKVNGDQSVKLVVWGPRGCEDLVHRADVLLHSSFLNGLLLEWKNSCVYLVSKDLKKWYEVLDATEDGWYLKPSAEALLLTPGRGVLVDIGRGEAFGDSRMCIILCSC